MEETKNESTIEIKSAEHFKSLARSVFTKNADCPRLACDEVLEWLMKCIEIAAKHGESSFKIIREAPNTFLKFTRFEEYYDEINIILEGKGYKICKITKVHPYGIYNGKRTRERTEILGFEIYWDYIIS